MAGGFSYHQSSQIALYRSTGPPLHSPLRMTINHRQREGLHRLAPDLAMNLKTAVQPQMNTDGHGFAADCRADSPHPPDERLRRCLHQCLLRSPQHTLHPKLPRRLPLPFRRGEGWGEGLLGVVYPASLAVSVSICGFASGSVLARGMHPHV